MKSKTLTCLYLYSDRHAVAIYEKRDPDAGIVQFAEVIECLTAPDAHMVFKGRIVFGSYHCAGMLELLKGAKLVHATVPTVEQGTETMKKLGFALGTLEIQLKQKGTIAFDSFPRFCSSQFTYDENQERYAEAFNPDLTMWGDYRIAKIHRAKKELV